VCLAGIKPRVLDVDVVMDALLELLQRDHATAVVVEDGERLFCKLPSAEGVMELLRRWEKGWKGGGGGERRKGDGGLNRERESNTMDLRLLKARVWVRCSGTRVTSSSRSVWSRGRSTGERSPYLLRHEPVFARGIAERLNQVGEGGLCS
jgi:hypothetical protein